MKVMEVIFEDEEIVDDIHVLAQKIAGVLKRDCGPFLSQINLAWPIWRGVKNVIPPEFGEYPCPVGRKPLDTPRIIHALANEWFDKHTGVKFRSDAVFATGSKEMAAVYGPPCAMFPVGEFKFCWSPKVSDLTQDVADAVTASGMFPFTGGNTDERERFFDIMSRSDYQTTDIAGAIRSGNEAMVHCSTYYLIGGKNPRRTALVKYVMEELSK